MKYSIKVQINGYVLVLSIVSFDANDDTRFSPTNMTAHSL